MGGSLLKKQRTIHPTVAAHPLWSVMFHVIRKNHHSTARRRVTKWSRALNLSKSSQSFWYLHLLNHPTSLTNLSQVKQYCRQALSSCHINEKRWGISTRYMLKVLELPITSKWEPSFPSSRLAGASGRWLEKSSGHLFDEYVKLITTSSWWFQPVWKILVKLAHFPK